MLFVLVVIMLREVFFNKDFFFLFSFYIFEKTMEEMNFLRKWFQKEDVIYFFSLNKQFFFLKMFLNGGMFSSFISLKGRGRILWSNFFYLESLLGYFLFLSVRSKNFSLKQNCKGGMNFFCYGKNVVILNDIFFLSVKAIF